jgi:ribosomal protein S18 acetylase RimI-like enzyme
VEVRPAANEDAHALAELHVRSWQEAYVGQLPEEYLRSISVEARLAVWSRSLAPDATADVSVAVSDDAIVGFVMVDASRDDDGGPATGEVLAIYAGQNVWGEGVGRRLMDDGLQRLRDRGCGDATLWVLDSNARARRFYEIGGWSLDGSTKIADIGGVAVTEVRYRRLLS